MIGKMAELHSFTTLVLKIRNKRLDSKANLKISHINIMWLCINFREFSSNETVSLTYSNQNFIYNFTHTFPGIIFQHFMFTRELSPLAILSS